MSIAQSVSHNFGQQTQGFMDLIVASCSGDDVKQLREQVRPGLRKVNADDFVDDLCGSILDLALIMNILTVTGADVEDLLADLHFLSFIEEDLTFELFTRLG